MNHEILAMIASGLEPKNLYALVNLGGIFAALEDTAEARHWYEVLRTCGDQVIVRGGIDHWVYPCMGEAAVALGETDRAMLAYRQAIALKLPVEDLRSSPQ
jgi:hypothetical protein